MLALMEETQGRQHVAELVRAMMAWSGLSGPAIDATGRVSRASVDRIKRGDVTVSDTMLRALGDVLGLPRDYLLYVLRGDTAAIERSTADADLVRWTVDLMRDPVDDGLAVDESAPPGR